jgi:hypothetical protein
MSESHDTDLTREQGEGTRTHRTPSFGAFLVLLLTLVLFATAETTAFAATYSLSPASGSYPVGQTFTVQVVVTSNAGAVNTGDATITFDSNTLTAVSVARDGSPFNLWVTEPTIQGNTIAFAGGSTSGVSGSRAIMSITFRARAQGEAKVDFSRATLLAGAGQNVLQGTSGAIYTITEAAPPPTSPVAPPPQQEERRVNVPPPSLPDISSRTHPNQDEWYSVQNATFTWDIPYGVTAVSAGFSDESGIEPGEVFEPPVSEWKESDIPDGIWYFSSAHRNRGGWGSTTEFMIRVDTTPPEPFTVSAAGGDLTAQIRFEAKDTLSGIALYRVGIDGGRTRDVQSTELVSGGYTLTNLDPGERTITVIAVDQAGNEREESTTVLVTGVRPVPVSDDVKTSGFGAIYWVSLLFMAALAVVITMLVQERRRFHEEKELIKREAAEAGDKLINVFGVLRDEMEEKVLELSHKPNMTDNERNILEGLKDALDISEELIDKEIEDVRKLLK